MKVGKLTIYIDTREKTPLYFPGFQTIRKGLKYGDYSARGLLGICEIERKSAIDLLNSLTIQWTRFCKKLIRWKKLRSRIIVVEGTFDDVIENRYCKNGLRKIFMYNFCILSVAGIPILFAGSRVKATELIIKILQIERGRRR